MIQLKTILTALQIILCVFLIVIGLKNKEKLDILIGTCLIVISIL